MSADEGNTQDPDWTNVKAEAIGGVIAGLFLSLGGLALSMIMKGSNIGLIAGSFLLAILLMIAGWTVSKRFRSILERLGEAFIRLLSWLWKQRRYILLVLFAVLLIILELVLYGLGGWEFVAFSFAHLVLIMPLVLLLFAPKRATVALPGFEDDSRSSLDTRTTAVLRFGEQIAIRTFDNKYVTADENNDSSVVAKIEQITEWGVFEIVHASEPSATKKPVRYGDEVAFKVASSGNFVSARLDLQNELKANVSWLRGWETFILLHPTDTTAAQGKVVHYGDSFALQANNGKYVVYNVVGNGELSAVVSHIRPWAFVVVNPSDSK